MSQNESADKEIKVKIREHAKNISCMPKYKLTEALKLRNLDTEGVKKVLQLRLLRHDTKILKDPGKEHPDRIYNSFCTVSKSVGKEESTPLLLIVIDFEATCRKVNPYDYKHEIIEFPAVMVDTKKKAITKKFHSYVRPIINPVLTDFCIDLTGIDQKTVSNSPLFPEVLEKFEKWLCDNQCSKKNTVVVTDGDWDMEKFMYQQLKWNKLPAPWWATRWIDIRKVFRSITFRNSFASLASMLKYFGMEFEGRPHSGIDDSCNIARIMLRLLEKTGGKVAIISHMSQSNMQQLHEVHDEGNKEEGLSYEELNGFLGDDEDEGVKSISDEFSSIIFA